MRLSSLFQASAEGISSGLREMLEELPQEVRILVHSGTGSASCIVTDCSQIYSFAANYLSAGHAPRTLTEYGELVALQLADLPSVKRASHELADALREKTDILQDGSLDIILSSSEGRITLSDEITKALSPLFFNAVAVLAARGWHPRFPLGAL